MKWKAKIWGALILLLLLTSPYLVKAQGCSDAGFCSLEQLQPSTDSTLSDGFKTSLILGFSYGSGEENIQVSNPYIELSRRVHPNVNIGVKLTYLHLQGELEEVSGPGDIYISADYALKGNSSFLLGMKLPLSDGNRKTENGKSLPMPYQTSLGTVDLILGLSRRINRFEITLALQQPVTQNNNKFLPEQYPQQSQAQRFSPTYNYRRAGDAFLRFSYRLPLFNDRLQLVPNLLPIYHLADDEYMPPMERDITLKGSQGLTLNGSLFVSYSINSRNSVEFNYGAPFIIRENRPDGLTRSYVMGLEYKLRI